MANKALHLRLMMEQPRLGHSTLYNILTLCSHISLHISTCWCISFSHSSVDHYSSRHSLHWWVFSLTQLFAKFTLTYKLLPSFLIQLLLDFSHAHTYCRHIYIAAGQRLNCFWIYLAATDILEACKRSLAAYGRSCQILHIAATIVESWRRSLSALETAGAAAIEGFSR